MYDPDPVDVLKEFFDAARAITSHGIDGMGHPQALWLNLKHRQDVMRLSSALNELQHAENAILNIIKQRQTEWD